MSVIAIPSEDDQGRKNIYVVDEATLIELSVEYDNSPHARQWKIVRKYPGHTAVKEDSPYNCIWKRRVFDHPSFPDLQRYFYQQNHFEAPDGTLIALCYYLNALPFHLTHHDLPTEIDVSCIRNALIHSSRTRK
jgi:hypothetical protein